MKVKPIVFLITYFFFFFNQNALAQLEKLTLQKAIEHTLAENPVIKQMEAQPKS
jgi:hypothetical protein